MLLGETNLVLFKEEAFSSDIRTAWSLFKKDRLIKVLTIDGFKNIQGFRRAISDKLIHLKFDNGLSLRCTPDHLINTKSVPMIAQEILNNINDYEIFFAFLNFNGSDRYINSIEALLRQGPDWLPSYLYIDNIKDLLELLTKGVDWRSFFVNLGFKSDRTAYNWLKTGKCPLSLIRTILDRYSDALNMLDMLLDSYITLRRGKSKIPVFIDMSMESFKILTAIGISSLRYVDLSCEKGIILFNLKKRDDRDLLLNALANIESRAKVRIMESYIRIQDKLLYIFFRWILGITPQISLRSVIRYPFSKLQYEIALDIIRKFFLISGNIISGSDNSCYFETPKLLLDVLRMCAPALKSFKIINTTLMVSWASHVLSPRLFYSSIIEGRELKTKVLTYDVFSSSPVLVLAL